MSLNMHTPDGGQSLSGNYDGKIAGLYDLEKTLGSGHFAVVKLARHVFTGEKVAIKVVDKTKLDEVSKAHLFQEVRCMKLVQHPNVVRLYEVIDTQTKLYLILELGDGGDLYDYIMKHEGGLSEDLARKYFRQIVRAISYCHQLHVVHRDLKPANVVFFEKLGIVKLTDFGFSNKFSPGQKLETSCGSLAYSAPEILLGDSYDAPAVGKACPEYVACHGLSHSRSLHLYVINTPIALYKRVPKSILLATDIWSLGVILYMLVCGQPPFEKANDSETLTMIMDCKYSMPGHVTVTCRRLIASMLVRDPEKRATLDQISQDVWLNQHSGQETPTDYALVSREQVSEDEHDFIIQKMVNGEIASKEEILQSLDRNKYNHITATYFLLAERKLRQLRQEQMELNPPEFDVPPDPPNNRIAPVVNNNALGDNRMQSDQGNQLMVPVSIEVRNSIEYVSDGTTEKRNRKCSIVREEDEDECEFIDKNELIHVGNRRCSQPDGRVNRGVQDRGLVDSQYVSNVVIEGKATADTGGLKNTHTINQLGSLHLEERNANADTYKKSQHPNTVKTGSGKIDHSMQHRVHQKIPPINEQVEGGGIAEPDPNDAQHDLSGIKDLEINKIRNKNPVLMHRRTKLNKMRTPSCSSSEASDDDTKSRKKKINKIVGDTPNRFRVHRRDSHDDSSDSQDPANFGTGGQSNTNTVLNTSKDRKTTSGKKEEQSKSVDTRNSNSKQKKGCSLMQKCLPKVGARRRLRESQSLDRITESQEYEQRQRYSHITQTCNESSAVMTQFQSMSLVSNDKPWPMDKLSGTSEEKINNKEPNSRALKNMCDMNSIEEIDLYIGMNVAKAIQTTGSKCSLTMKRIRRLGKYFPVVNLS